MQLWPLHGGFLHVMSSTRQLGASVLTAVRHGVVSRAAADFAIGTHSSALGHLLGCFLLGEEGVKLEVETRTRARVCVCVCLSVSVCECVCVCGTGTKKMCQAAMAYKLARRHVHPVYGN